MTLAVFQSHVDISLTARLPHALLELIDIDTSPACI